VQFVKYSIGGAIATAVDVAVFYTAAILLLPALGPTDPVARLLGLSVAPLAEGVRSTRYVADKVIAFLFSNLAAYIVNVLWVFTPGRHSKAMEFTLFFLVSIGQLHRGDGSRLAAHQVDRPAPRPTPTRPTRWRRCRSTTSAASSSSSKAEPPSVALRRSSCVV